MDGSRKRFFLAYNPSYLGGFDIGILDIDVNSTQDVITAPAIQSEKVRIWDGKVKKIDQWNPFETSIQAMHILLY